MVVKLAGSSMMCYHIQLNRFARNICLDQMRPKMSESSSGSVCLLQDQPDKSADCISNESNGALNICKGCNFYVSFKLYRLVDRMQLNAQPPRARILPFPTLREGPKPCEFI